MGLSDESAFSADTIVALFTDSFAASEGAEEGALIGGLVEKMLETPAQELCVYTASDAGRLIGCICFSRLDYPQDPRQVMLLSPVAVATSAQGKGVGQALITHGLNALRAEGIDMAITYGDPAFYGRVGFSALTEEMAPPPLPLSHPEGWIGQSLSGADLSPLKGPSSCVAALNKPDYW
ncbi:GNAT family N-acetyltransferase [Nioella sp.]|uniref:GNAT family N-acetyltransferase n=1 Tax=Nioella sp. TaxID=1912091 RepID=UPI003A883FCD